MPYNKRFLKYVLESKIINGSPKFILYKLVPEFKTYSQVKELQAQCEHAETTIDVGVKCTVTDTSGDNYTVDKIELHVNRYRYAWAEETYSDTKIDTAYYSTSKNESEYLRIIDRVTFTSAGYVEV